MYVSLYPCSMCREVIKESKIKKVYYYTENNKSINNKIQYIKIDDNDLFFSKELSSFFDNKR